MNCVSVAHRTAPRRRMIKRERPKRSTSSAVVRRRSSLARKPSPPAVLVVDDDADARLIYSQMLRAKGCVVFTAQDGLVALEKARTLGPDIVIMDLAMPRLD